MATTVVARKNVLVHSKPQRGFSLLEVVISMAVLTIGLVSLLGVFCIAMAATQDTQQDMIAKQLANEAIESIVTARDTAQLQWDAIQNVADGGIFLNNLQQIYTAGGDGILGTADDVAGGQYQTLTEPGPDGIYGTGDDVQLPLSNYQRQIQIQPVLGAGGAVDPTLRIINITIQYNTPRMRAAKTYVLTTYISQFR
ncbi:MAG: prepilin-type N-terminal cleavage/methylation domain-containing protein [Terriglobales bacterium]